MYRTVYQYEVLSETPLPADFDIRELAREYGAGRLLVRVMSSLARRLTESQKKRLANSHKVVDKAVTEAYQQRSMCRLCFVLGSANA